MATATRETYEAHFGLWLVRHWKRVLAVVSPLMGASTLNLVKPWLPDLLSAVRPYDGWAPYLINLVALFVIALLVIRKPSIKPGRYPEASHAVRNFALLWAAIWWCWLLQYLVVTIDHFPLAGGVAMLERWKHAGAIPDMPWFVWTGASNLLALATCALIVCCYLVLAHPRVSGGQIVGQVAAGSLPLLVVLEWDVFLAAANLMTPQRFQLSQLMGGIFFGALFCVSLCVLVGRLESKIIAPPLTVIVLLYVYGALQLAVNVLASAQTLSAVSDDIVATSVAVSAWLFLVAALLKGLLFLFGYWLLQSGVLLFYMHWMVEAGADGSGIDAKRRRFVQQLSFHDVPAPIELQAPPVAPIRTEPAAPTPVRGQEPRPAGFPGAGGDEHDLGK